MPPSHAEPAAPHWVVVATGVTALILVVLPVLWHGLAFVGTAFHEAGHALTGMVRGLGVKHVKIPRRGNAETGFHRGVDHVVVALAGYLGPTGFGLLGAAILRNGSTEALLWVLDVGLVLLLLAVRNVFGFFVVGALLAVSMLVSWFGSAGTRMGYSYVLVWFLLLAAVREMFRLTRLVFGGAKGSDAHAARDLTRVPWLVWLLVFWAGTLGGLWLGYRILMYPS